MIFAVRQQLKTWPNFFDPRPSLSSVATDDTKQFQCLNKVINNKTTIYWLKHTLPTLREPRGMAGTLRMRTVILSETVLAMPCWRDLTRAKQLSITATAGVIWLYPCVRYWPYRGVRSVCFRSYYGLINIKTGPFFWNFKKTRLKFSWIHLLEDGSSVQKCIFLIFIY